MTTTTDKPTCPNDPEGCDVCEEIARYERRADELREKYDHQRTPAPDVQASDEKIEQIIQDIFDEVDDDWFDADVTLRAILRRHMTSEEK